VLIADAALKRIRLEQPVHLGERWLYAIVAEFAKVDPKSYSYRYPVDIHGKEIPLGVEVLDLAVLKDVMDGVGGYFTGSDGYLDHLEGGGS